MWCGELVEDDMPLPDPAAVVDAAS